MSGKVLNDLTSAQARIEELEAKLAASQNAGTVTVRVGQSGTICIYGLGRYPLVAYPSGWKRVLQEGTVSDIIRLVNLSTNDPAAFERLRVEAALRSEAKSAKRA
jgi:hypothetical protein